MGVEGGRARGGQWPWTARLGGLLALCVMLSACGAMVDSERALVLDERNVELAERVGEQARDEHVDEIRALWQGAVANGDGEHPSLSDVSSGDGAGGDLLTDITPPEGVADVEVHRDRAKRGTWEDDGLRTVMARSVVVTPEEGEPFCAVVAVSDNGEFRGVPALGEPDDGCHDPTIRRTAEYDPMLAGWGQTDW